MPPADTRADPAVPRRHGQPAEGSRPARRAVAGHLRRAIGAAVRLGGVMNVNLVLGALPGWAIEPDNRPVTGRASRAVPAVTMGSLLLQQAIPSRPRGSG